MTITDLSTNYPVFIRGNR